MLVRPNNQLMGSSMEPGGTEKQVRGLKPSGDERGHGRNHIVLAGPIHDGQQPRDQMHIGFGHAALWKCLHTLAMINGMGNSVCPTQLRCNKCVMQIFDTGKNGIRSLPGRGWVVSPGQPPMYHRTAADAQPSSSGATQSAHMHEPKPRLLYNVHSCTLPHRSRGCLWGPCGRNNHRLSTYTEQWDRCPREHCATNNWETTILGKYATSMVAANICGVTFLKRDPGPRSCVRSNTVCTFAQCPIMAVALPGAM